MHRGWLQSYHKSPLSLFLFSICLQCMKIFLFVYFLQVKQKKKQLLISWNINWKIKFFFEFQIFQIDLTKKSNGKAKWIISTRVTLGNTKWLTKLLFLSFCLKSEPPFLFFLINLKSTLKKYCFRNKIYLTERKEKFRWEKIFLCQTSCFLTYILLIHFLNTWVSNWLFLEMKYENKIEISLISIIIQELLLIKIPFQLPPEVGLANWLSIVLIYLPCLFYWSPIIYKLIFLIWIKFKKSLICGWKHFFHNFYFY